MKGERHGVHAAEVTAAAAPEMLGVGIEDLLPEATMRNADAVVVARDRRKVQRDDDALGRRPALAQEGEGVVFGIVRIDPLEARRRAFGCVQGGLAAIEVIEIAEQKAQRRMRGRIEKRPLESAVVIPFRPLAEICASQE